MRPHHRVQQTEAAREKELARQLSSKYEEWTKRQAATGEAVPRGLERLIEELLPTWSLAPVVTALQALRGVNLVVAVTFVVNSVSR